MSALRASRLSANRVPVGLRAQPARRTFFAKPRLCGPKIVEVVSYDQGNRRQETLTVKHDATVKAPVGDASRPAVKYDPQVATGLTPTLKSFTLEGKTAVVTG